MQSVYVSIQEALKSVIDYQTHFQLREAQGRSSGEDLNTRVTYWLVREALILLVVSIAQVLLLKSFSQIKDMFLFCFDHLTCKYFYLKMWNKFSRRPKPRAHSVFCAVNYLLCSQLVLDYHYCS